MGTIEKELGLKIVGFRRAKGIDWKAVTKVLERQIAELKKEAKRKNGGYA